MVRVREKQGVRGDPLAIGCDILSVRVERPAGLRTRARGKRGKEIVGGGK